MNGRESETTSAVKALYERFPYPNHGTVGSLVPRMVSASVERLSRRRSAKVTVVDVGCGTGEQTVGLAKAYPQCEVVGIDVSERSIEIAEALARSEGVAARFERHDLARGLNGVGPFDLVVCVGVLHHLARPRDAMATLADIVAPDGEMVGMVYGRLGRRRIVQVQEVLGILDPEANAMDRVSLLRDVRRWPLLKDRAERAIRRLRFGPDVDPFEAAKRILKGRRSEEYLVDMYAHVQERDYTWVELYDQLTASGWKVLGWPERSGMPDDPSDVLTPTSAERATSMELRERGALLELLVEPDKLYFVAEPARASRAADAAEPADHLDSHEVREGVAELYEEYPYPNHGVIGSVVARMLERPLQSRPSAKPLRLLDAGCGTGEQTLGVARSFEQVDVFGVDYNQRSIERARHFSREHGISARFERRDLMQPLDGDGPFDVIVSIGVLHTLPDSDVGFRNLRAVAAPDCVFLGMVYGVFGRYHYCRVRDILRRLCGEDATRDERLEALRREGLAGNAGPVYYAETLFQRARYGPKIAPLEAARRVVAGRNAAYQADAYDHVKDDGYTWREIDAMLTRTGWELTGWPEGAGFPSDPSALFQGRALDRSRTLSTLELASVYERLIEPGNLYFLARPR